MAELVDAHVSGACVERCAGSSPVLGTHIPGWISGMAFGSCRKKVGEVAELVDALL